VPGERLREELTGGVGDSDKGASDAIASKMMPAQEQFGTTLDDIRRMPCNTALILLGLRLRSIAGRKSGS
jgi:hypothetical protein